jgi:hypothetical protein
VNHAIDLIIFAILTLAGLVMDFIAFVDSFLASLMTSAHVPPNAQIILLVVVAVALVVMALRALGGVFGALIIVLLVLLLVHQSFPKMQVPQAHLPGGFAVPGQIHTNV